MSCYASHFTPQKLVVKCRRAAKAAGREVVEKALAMRFALENPDTPAWAKAMIVGALGYFIFPADTVPDVIPGVGYGDDLGMLAGAMAAVAVYVDAQARRKAVEQLRAWGMD